MTMRYASLDDAQNQSFYIRWGTSAIYQVFVSPRLSGRGVVGIESVWRQPPTHCKPRETRSRCTSDCRIRLGGAQ